MPSDAWNRFEQSLNDTSSRAAMERFDLEALAALAGSERDAAEQRLIDLLGSGNGDPRVPHALQALGSARGLDAMRRLVGRLPPDDARVAVAEILWTGERSAAA